ncbi:MAG: helix-turn-helix domain-containing protein [Flavobacteriales bacterium]|jgi:transcriptional regulator with XRE-family HTH domain|nr:helix-turn-helix domain-containing protein [Flavobacteriales bacterium]
MMKTPEPYRSAILDELLAQITPQQQEKVSIKMRAAVRIADRLEELRMQKKELAEACGLKGSSMVTKWLSGGHNFTLDTLVDIGHALGMSVADLLRAEEEKVVFSTTVIVQAPALSQERQTVAMGEMAFVSRSSNAAGAVPMVSDPVYHYGQQKPCLA